MIQPQESREAEMCVIGSVLKLEDRVGDALFTLSEFDFFHADLRSVFETFQFLKTNKRGIDQLTVHQTLVDQGLAEEVRSPEILAECIGLVPNEKNIQYYLNIVREKSEKRQLVEACRNVAMATSGNTKSDDVLENARKIFSNLKAITSQDSVSSISKESGWLIEDLERIKADPEDPKIITTGFDKLDKALDGILPQDMIIVSALPGMGKSALALNVICHLCGGSQRLSGGLITLEMDAQSYTRRLYSHESNVPLGRFKQRMTDEELRAIKNAQKFVSNWKLFIDHERTLTVSGLSRKITNLYKLQKVDFIVLDYFQLLSDDKVTNKLQYLSNASQVIFDLTRELKIPIIVVAQANRKLVDKDKFPDFDCIEYCPKLAQDADKVMFMKWVSRQNESGISSVDFHLIKNRQGPSGRIIPMTYDGIHAKFRERQGETNE